MRLYNLWKNKRIALEKGVDRKELSQWTRELTDFRGELYRAYLDAGIKKFELVEFCVRRRCSLEDLLKKKQFFMEKGMDEKTAEEWLELYFREPEIVEFLWGQELELVKSLVHARIVHEVEYPVETGLASGVYEENITIQDLQGFIRLSKKHGIEKALALQEMRYFAEKEWFVFKDDYGNFNKEFIDYVFEEANKKGFKSLILWLRIRGEKDKIERAKERKSFYLSFGLDEIVAEWWIAHEFVFRKELSEKHKDAIMSLKTPLDINRFFYVLSQLAKKRQEEDIQSALEWIKNGLVSYINYTDLETAKRWMEFGFSPQSFNVLPENLSPQDFKELLEKSHCNPDELVHWIWKEGIEKVQAWFKLDVKDRYTALSLNSAGLDPDKLSSVLRLMSLEEVIKVLSERGPKGLEDEYEKRLNDKLYKKVVGLFRKKT